MRIIPLKESIHSDYCVKELFSMRQKWHENQVYNVLSKPKKNHALLYFSHCGGEYLLPDGTCIEANIGDIFFLPKSSCYKTTFFNTSENKANTWLINFQLYDENGEEFAFFDKVAKLKNDNTGYIFGLFKEVEQSYTAPVCSIPKTKALLLRILAELAENHHQSNLAASSYETILPGILYLEKNPDQSKSIDELAKLCHVSSTCFRKLFKCYSGVSPVDFRIHKRLEHAKQLLANEFLTVGEVSRQLGYDDVAYFSRLFKKKVGQSPSEYARCFCEGFSACEKKNSDTD